MCNLTPTMSAMKGTTRKNKGNLILLRETRSGSARGRRMTDANEVSGVNVSLPPLLNPFSGSSSGSGTVSVPLNSHQGIMQQCAVRLPPLGMQESNEGGKAYEGRISLKKERLCELGRLPDLYGGMSGMLDE
ncbi:uncharacterized protein MONOS_14837 [Monocercomonoides exilis]|uniref:uncharacterized protein n=1 Tax=Monocercomonoides exilis TaxID=2049356 RepID=UPI00355A10C9|nr:hypothetical protein MONOS_14837 [Monocercomonoides exilis]|eukprot:MONOS_14837.1-p1 / transcript=MONOS_14837.1 / gene=MONOS_14837 / organism=Monocercomonoides_exilis_PA203 / gene_product=unspecified product / transcript_product=unspecified product / location=Mono_scaffold01083:5334-5801(-) / protein_length=132 / sequence_SO=supercontig / SO=protein_coding / is_pseudo=false